MDIVNGYLTISVPKNPAATDITFSAESTGDLASPFTGASTTVLTNDAAVFQARDDVPISAEALRFLRLHIARQ